MAKGLIFLTILAIGMQNYLAAGVDCKKHPARVDLTTCCPIPELVSDEVMEKCKEFMKLSLPSPMSGEPVAVSAEPNRTPSPPLPAYNDPQQQHHHKKPHGPYSCFMSCVLNETGIINEADKKINEARLSEYLKALNVSKDLIPVVENSFKTCSTKAETFHAKMQEKMKNRPSTTPLPPPSSSRNMSQDRMMRPPRCPPFAGHLMACVFMESFKNCPNTIWSNSRECNEMRDHMKECKPKFGQNNEDYTFKSTEEEI